MAALVQGVHYGLSSQGKFYENKSLIFVKLTDSAYRAIEDFAKNKNRPSRRPTIQFSGNEGVLQVPSGDINHGGHTTFKFSLQSNSDIEGPRGSFECIQQVPGNNVLQALGPMQYKMRIHAKEDVYEATKSRISIAEEIHKQNCTKEIKPGGVSFSRKVSKIARPPPSREPISASKHYPSNTKPSINGYVPSNHRIVNGGTVVPTSIHTKPQGNNHAQKPGNPNIAKRPLRERLIHYLAVRPYKKPELYDRITRDAGNRDKNVTETIQQVAMFRDNTYHLLRHIWNDVQEDWPFYTEQERQTLKRRKPQNLTPPGSSDGGSSSGSGQSPTSTHPGSPPTAISAPVVKRPHYYEGSDGFPTKKQRISHYRKQPAEPTSSIKDSTNSPLCRNNGYSNHSSMPTFGSNTQHTDQRFVPPEDEYEEKRRDGFNDREANSVFGSVSDKVNSSVYNSVSEREKFGSVVFNNVSERDKVSSIGFNNVNDRDKINSSVYNNVSERERVISSYNHTSDKVNSSGYNSVNDRDKISSNIYNNERDRVRTNDVYHSSSVPSGNAWDSSRTEKVASPTPNNRNQGTHHDNRSSKWSSNNVSDNTSADSRERRPQVPNNSDIPEYQYPDFQLTYTTILTPEQRSKYKADFNADYAEYRTLHAMVEEVSRRFSRLEESLKKAEKGSHKRKSIEEQILREYAENKRNRKHQETKRRFQYLHDKLSHIKRLVLEYDTSRLEKSY